MDIAIKKAEQHGISCVAVKNSAHYGIASYYSRYATEKNLVGMSFTNPMTEQSLENRNMSGNHG